MKAVERVRPRSSRESLIEQHGNRLAEFFGGHAVQAIRGIDDDASGLNLGNTALDFAHPDAMTHAVRFIQIVRGDDVAGGGTSTQPEGERATADERAEDDDQGEHQKVAVETERLQGDDA